MTKQLFWELPYETKFNAKITSIRNEGIILDQTLFCPKGGGQESDKGLLEKGDLMFNINNVVKEGDEIIHQLSTDFQKNLKIGDWVIGTIDWEHRYGIMKAHTSQHIFSAIIKKNFDIDTTHVNLNFEDVTFVLAKEISYEQLESALQEVNSICTLKNRKIYSRIVSREETKNLSNEIRGTIPNQDSIRIIEVENCDLICCGGTHVENSIEIGALFVYKFNRGREIKYFVGSKAINMLSAINADLLSISSALEQPISELKEKVEKNSILISNLYQTNKNLAIKSLKIISQCPITTLNDISIYIADLELEKEIFFKEFKNFQSNSVLVAKTGPKKILILSNSQNISANDIMQLLLKKFGGKGGGNPKSAQGTMENEPEDIISELKLLLKKNRIETNT